MTGAHKAITALAIALTLSLCLNAFMAGRLATLRMGPPPMAASEPPQRGGPGGEAGMRGPLRDFLRDLPADLREPFGASLRDNREQMGDNMRAIMDARRNTLEVFRTEPFDAEQLKAALAAQRAAQMQMQATVHESMVGVVQTLTPEQRAQLERSVRKVFR
jgi:uncharacterized membrane protein